MILWDRWENFNSVGISSLGNKGVLFVNKGVALSTVNICVPILYNRSSNVSWSFLLSSEEIVVIDQVVTKLWNEIVKQNFLKIDHCDNFA